MGHCPFCGTPVKDEESYCINCGKPLPDDMSTRLNKPLLNKFWYVPVGVLLLMSIIIGTSYLILSHKTTTAEELYNKGSVQLEKAHYAQAKDLFNDAVAYHPNFSQAKTGFSFAKTAERTEQDLEKAQKAAQEHDFQKALTLVSKAENNLKNYSGDAVVRLIDRLSEQRDAVKTIQLKEDLNKESSISDLKMLLWDAEAIATEEATQMANTIRERIVDYTHAKASEQINNNHFKDARIIVEDGLKYAPESEKLLSLETTIENEQEAFETMQQERIEQAINTANEEQEINENDAIELVKVTAKDDEQGNLLVTGEVKSVATIPINTILIEYSLSSGDGDPFATHHAYVFPDKLYPGEIGQFEFTHYDIKDKGENVQVQVDTIKWYTK
ncbi:hypothetical protein JNUCC1_00098 [Lentibacillus sp. JNUCC-1]|uniref:zinc ribbon domain-containing protein n=1 Tax=Lentibacillus sp. JNUCC-1 TaxID=2654513 RepID=UPI0012E96AD1|nr:zinc ribbon domain-containing protein [Lentibacillus sp. JNUCC-1]MUV36297.1 hypothetical protein [Lentibacillus sp. JNUCC-1]